MKKFKPVEGVEGLYILKNGVSKDEERSFMRSSYIFKGEQMLHAPSAKEVGFKYDPMRDSYPIEEKDWICGFSPWMYAFWHKLITETNLKDIIGNVAQPDHVIINTYTNKDELVDHYDSFKFDDWVVGSSYSSDCLFNFKTVRERKLIKQVKIPRRSVYIFTGKCRKEMTHGFDKQQFKHDIRLSATFRSYDKKMLNDELRYNFFKKDVNLATYKELTL